MEHDGYHGDASTTGNIKAMFMKTSALIWPLLHRHLIWPIQKGMHRSFILRLRLPNVSSFAFDSHHMKPGDKQTVHDRSVAVSATTEPLTEEHTVWIVVPETISTQLSWLTK